MLNKNKIKTKAQIREIVEQLRREKPDVTIVTTNGAFDMLHAGHVYSLEHARQFGDVFIVGLNSDSSIKGYKSPKRPVIGENDRAYMLASLAIVDYIVIFDELTSNDFLEHVHPNVHVKSRSGFTGVEREVVEKNGGRIELVDDLPGLSTTNIIKKIKDLDA